MATKQYTAAVIGVGAVTNSHGKKGGGHQIGYTHAEMYQRSPRARLTCAADINADNLAAFRDKWGGAGEVRGFADYRQMLREAKPDIVSLCTYVGLRREMIEACAAAGVTAVFSEKPFLPSPADCAAIRDVVKQTGIKIVVGHPRRHRRAFVRAKQLTADGAIGQPRIFLSAIGGWDLNEMGAHWFDLMRFWNDDRPITWAFGQARVRDFRGYGHAMEEAAVGEFAFDNGVRGLLEAGHGMNGSDNFTLVGTDGVIHLYGEHKLAMQSKGGSVEEDHTGTQPIGWDALGVRGEKHDWVDLWDMLLHELVTWIEGGPQPGVGFDSAIQTCEATLAVYASAVLGDRVHLPFDERALAIKEYPVEILARRQKAGAAG